MNNLISKALVVEDDKINQKICCWILRNLKCEVDVAATGTEALSFAEKKEYDVILTDLGLPDIEGIDLLKQLRTNLKIKTPVIVLTAHGSALEQDCLNAGANHFFIKPTDLKILQMTIQQCIKNSVH